MIDLLSGFERELVLDYIWLKLRVLIPLLNWPIIGNVLEKMFDHYFGPVVQDLLRLFNFNLVDWEKAKTVSTYQKVLGKIKEKEIGGLISEEEESALRREYRKALFDVVHVHIPTRGNV